MSTTTFPDGTELNRLRSAAALIPIVRSNLSNGKISRSRAQGTINFLEWAATCPPTSTEEAKLLEVICAGIDDLRNTLAARV